MADRGFDVAHLMPDGVGLNIPPFLGSRSQLEEEEVGETRRIASVRIHVERAIERIKNFRITHFIPSMVCPLAEEIVFVCAFLSNYMDPLVHPLCMSKPAMVMSHRLWLPLPQMANQQKPWPVILFLVLTNFSSFHVKLVVNATVDRFAVDI